MGGDDSLAPHLPESPARLAKSTCTLSTGFFVQKLEDREKRRDSNKTPQDIPSTTYDIRYKTRHTTSNLILCYIHCLFLSTHHNTLSLPKPCSAAPKQPPAIRHSPPTVLLSAYSPRPTSNLQQRTVAYLNVLRQTGLLNTAFSHGFHAPPFLLTPLDSPPQRADSPTIIRLQGSCPFSHKPLQDCHR